MHWRYDEGDYGVHCKKIGDKGICGALQRMDPEQVGKRLAAAMQGFGIDSLKLLICVLNSAKPLLF